MTEVSLKSNLKEIKNTLLQLPPKELINLYYEIQDRIETYEMMSLAETGFKEWLDPEEDIYDEGI